MYGDLYMTLAEGDRLFAIWLDRLAELGVPVDETEDAHPQRFRHWYDARMSTTEALDVLLDEGGA